MIGNIFSLKGVFIGAALLTLGIGGYEHLANGADLATAGLKGLTTTFNYAGHGLEFVGTALDMAGGAIVSLTA